MSYRVFRSRLGNQQETINIKKTKSYVCLYFEGPKQAILVKTRIRSIYSAIGNFVHSSSASDYTAWC